MKRKDIKQTGFIPRTYYMHPYIDEIINVLADNFDEKKYRYVNNFIKRYASKEIKKINDEKIRNNLLEKLERITVKRTDKVLRS